jgi:hypothetical protein
VADDHVGQREAHVSEAEDEQHLAELQAAQGGTLRYSTHTSASSTSPTSSDPTRSTVKLAR